MGRHRLAACLLLAACLGSCMANDVQLRRELYALPSGDKHPWDKLLADSFFFYEGQQSGRLPSWNRARKGKPGGWRDNSHTWDGFGPETPGVDLSGGFYEAGNHLKCVLQLGHTLSTLAFTMLTNERAFRLSGQWDNALRNLKWGAQWLVKAHLVSSPNPAVNKLVVQVGHPATDNHQWTRPEQMRERGKRGSLGYRPVFDSLDSTTGAATDMLAQTSGTMTVLAMLLKKPGKNQDIKLAGDLVARARNLQAAADAGKKGVWMPPYGTFQYPSSSWEDDVAWAAAAMCWSEMKDIRNPTKMPASCLDALGKFEVAYNKYGYNLMWDWNTAMVPAAFALIINEAKLIACAGSTPAAITMAHQYIDNLLSNWMDGPACPRGEFQVCYTKGGLAWFTQWASLRYAGLTGCVASTASLLGADSVHRRQYRCWTRKQLSYMAGDNPLQQSYIVGYQASSKHKPADKCHHRSSSCNPNFKVNCTKEQLRTWKPNPSVLKGALIGGPDNHDQFVNRRSNYRQNEVALDYNGGFTCSLAALTRATYNLQKHGCSWDKYCSGGCDTCADE